MKKLNSLINLQGKKIIWSGFDPSSDAYVVLFEEGVAISIPDFELIDDMYSVVDSLLAEGLTEAKQLVALEKLFSKEEESVENSVEEVESGTPQSN